MSHAQRVLQEKAEKIFDLVHLPFDDHLAATQPASYATRRYAVPARRRSSFLPRPDSLAFAV